MVLCLGCRDTHRGVPQNQDRNCTTDQSHTPNLHVLHGWCILKKKNGTSIILLKLPSLKKIIPSCHSPIPGCRFCCGNICFSESIIIMLVWREDVWMYDCRVKLDMVPKGLPYAICLYPHPTNLSSLWRESIGCVCWACINDFIKKGQITQEEQCKSKAVDPFHHRFMDTQKYIRPM